MTNIHNLIDYLETAKQVIEEWIPMFEQCNSPAGIDATIDFLKELVEKGCWQDLKDHSKGHWEDTGDPMTLECSECGYEVGRHNNTNYCPRCGAYMKEDESNEKV